MANKCQQCDLVNWDDDKVCKRCGASLHLTTPPVYLWFVAYCIFMALLYLATIVIGMVFMFIEPDQDMSATEQRITGVVCIIMGLVFLVPFASAPFLPRKSWVWILGLVLICIGLTSTCCLPACIPLLVFWLKPEMKAFYGRGLTPIPTPPPPPQWS